MRWRSWPRERWAGVALTAAAGVALGGCGGGGDGGAERADEAPAVGVTGRAATARDARTVPDARTTTAARTTPDAREAAVSVRARAAAYRRALPSGEIVGRIVFAPGGDDALVLAGLEQAVIDRGPGWYPRSKLPGEGGLIYIAGHNRTHGGPFGPVARLRRGDVVTLVLPYAIASYRVGARRLVHERRVSVLRDRGAELLRLQTSTVPPGPRRIVVDARPLALVPE